MWSKKGLQSRPSPNSIIVTLKRLQGLVTRTSACPTPGESNIRKLHHTRKAILNLVRHCAKHITASCFDDLPAEGTTAKATIAQTAGMPLPIFLDFIL